MVDGNQLFHLSVMATCSIVKASAPNKSAMDEKQRTEITVNFGIFFDGTNNQRLQVAMGKLKRAKDKGKQLEKDEERMIDSLAWDNASKKEVGETNIQALDRLSGFRVGMPRSSMQNVDFTNIARLEPLYDYTKEADYTYRIYVTGSGTFADLNKGVDVTGLAAGQNSAGVVQKVIDALNAIAKVVGKYMTDDSIDKVHYSFNVFGFSRGATEARLFVDLCSKVRDGKRPKKLKKIIQKYNKDFAIEKKMKSDSSAISFVKQTEIKFPFVGLFDTVSSVGVDAGIWNNSILAGGLELAESLSSSVSKFHKQNKDDLGLDTLVEDGFVEHVVHICALDEFRENFSLQVLPLVSKVDQFFLPGTHADIGGGDLEGYAEEKYIPKVYKQNNLYLPTIVTPGRSQNKKNLIGLNLAGLKELGWIKDDDIITKDKEDTLILKKHSEYGYSFLPLNIMANKARKYTCSFKELKSKYQIPEDLPQTFSNVQTNWSGIGGKFGHCYFPCDEGDIKNKKYKKLRQKYLHFSSCIKETLGIAFVNAPNLTYSNDGDNTVLYYDRFLPLKKIDQEENIEKLIKEAQLKYPQKAGKIEGHHITPKYLGGDANGPILDIDAAYHQVITNAFREKWPYGKGVPPQNVMEKILKEVYSKYPLPQT